MDSVSRQLLMTGQQNDPFRSNVSLLLHFDGANGSTTFTDSSPSPKTISRFGNTQISTTQSRFGGSSGLFDGSGDYLSTPASSGGPFDFGGGDFTVETFVYMTAANGVQECIAAVCDSPGTTPFALTITTNTRLVGGTWKKSGAEHIGVQSTTQVPLNEWCHIAFVRNGSSLMLFFNGSLEGSASVSGTQEAPNSAFTIGRFGDWTSDERYFNGYMDEFRVTKGVARYTSAFTPPAYPFPDF